jgi:galactokinase
VPPNVSGHHEPASGSRTRDLHQRAFGDLPVHVLTVPGRVELLGLASARHEGLVLTAAVDRCLTVAASPRGDGQVGLMDGAQERPELFWLHDLQCRGQGVLADPVKSLLRVLQRKRAHFSGFNLTFQDAIPPGPGFGGDAARAVGVMLALRCMFPFAPTELGAGPAPRRDRRGHLPSLTSAERKLLARWCQEARGNAVVSPESRFDPLPSLLGRVWHLMGIDCRFGTVDWYPLIGVALVCCRTGLGGDETDARAWEASEQECAAAARALLAKSLRSVEPAYLRCNRGRLTARQHACAYHVVGEIQRVVFAERALREEDHQQLGYYLSSSHESLRDHWGGTEPELDRLAGLARVIPGCLGARMVGRGPSARVLSLVPCHRVEPFLQTLDMAWKLTTGRSCRPDVLQPVGGAG